MTIRAVNRLSIQRWRYDYALRELKKAYKASRESVDNDRKSICRSMDRHQDTKPEIEDQDEQYIFEMYQDHLIDLHHETDTALRLIKEGFVVIIYHFWERQALEWYTFNKNKYDYGVAYKKLPGEGYLIDKDGLEKLRKTANVIKHDSSELYGKYKSMFTMDLDEDYKAGAKSGYYPWLSISDEDMKYFFEMLKNCGPNATARVGF
jgi:hypothetical protein